MNEPEVKVGKRWIDYHKQYKDSARIIDGVKILGKRRTISCARSMSGFDTCFARFMPGYLMYIGPGSEKELELCKVSR